MKKDYFIAIMMVLSVPSAGADISPEKATENRWLEQSLPSAWSCRTTADDDLFQPAAMPGGEWWRSFEDNILDSLIDMGLQRNYDLRTAMNRIASARQAVGEASSSYYPRIGLSAGYSKARTAGAAEGHSIPSTDASAFTLGANMSWEIDVFGRITEQVRQSKSQVELSRADFEGARLTIAAEIATQYVNLRKCQMQLAIANEHIASQKRVLEISEARFEAGLVSKLDVAQAKTVYYSTLTGLPGLEAQCDAALNAIALLVAAYPEEITPLTGYNGKLPPYIQHVSAGVPTDLLRRRPDIIAAERTIDINARAIGIAKKDYLPSLSLNGSVGTSAHRAGYMFGKNSLEYEIAPTLSWTLFEGFYRKYAVADTKIKMQSAIEQYNYTVMNAVMEAQNAMTAYKAAVKSIEYNRQALEQSAESFDLSISQYKEGLTSFTNVMNAQLSWLENANSNVEAQATALTDLIQLYRALGGSTNPE